MSKKQRQSPSQPAKSVHIEAAKDTTSVPSTNYTQWFVLLGIILLTYVVFSKANNYDFVNWDDDRNVYENQLIKQVNKDNFWAISKEIFKTPVIGNYNPLPIWTFAIEKVKFGLDHPGKFHRTNLMLHLACVLTAFLLCRRLKLGLWGSALVTFLFALHPLRIESVVWVTERKDVLFGLFYLLALLYYVKYKDEQKTWQLAAVVLCFILSLFSKIQAVSLPLSMIAIDYLRGEQISISTIIKSKWFYFGLSLLFGIIGIYCLKQEGSLASNKNTFPFYQRIFIGSYSLMVYLIKSILPYRMSPLYPYPSSMPVGYYPTILMFPLFGWALYYAYKKELKTVAFGLLFFFVNIVFLLQILGAGQGFIADRFTYIAYFGIFFILGYYFEKMLATPQKANIAIGAAALMSASYLYLDIKQIPIWKNSETLWTHVLQYYDKITLPFGNRANYLRDNKRYRDALKDYNAAIALKPEPQTHNSRARLFFDLAKSQDTILLALADYNKAIELKPNDGEFYINRGATYARLGKYEEALSDINKGLTLKPDHAVGYLNRFIMYETLKDYPKAFKDMETYIKFEPQKSDSYYELGRLKILMNDFAGSIPYFNQAIQMNPSKGVYFHERGVAYLQMQQIEMAKKDVQMAIQLKYPNVNPALKQAVGL